MAQRTRRKPKGQKDGASKKKNKGPLLLKTEFSWPKPPGKGKKDRPKAALSIDSTTANENWQTLQPFSEVSKSVGAILKAGKKKTAALDKKWPSMEQGYLTKGDNDKILKFISDVFALVGSDQNLASNPNVTRLVKAPKGALNDIKAGSAIGNTKSDSAPVEAKNDEEKKDAPSDAPSGSPRFRQEQVDAAVQRKEAEMEQMIRTLKEQLHIERKKNENLETSMKEMEAQRDEVQEEWQKMKDKYEPETQEDNVFAAIDARSSDNEEDKLRDAFAEAKTWKERFDEEQELRVEITQERDRLQLELSRATALAETTTKAFNEMKEKGDVEAFEQLEQDYEEAEKELDMYGQKLTAAEEALKEATEQLKELQKWKEDHLPLVEMQPQLEGKVKELEEEVTSLRKSSSEVSKKKTQMEEKVEELQKRDVVPREDLKKARENMSKMQKEMKREIDKRQEQLEKMSAELCTLQEKLFTANTQVGELTEENKKLVAGGGKDVNLGIDLDMDLDFSLFREEELEFPPNMSRNELIKWANHVKTMFAEMNALFCDEVNTQAMRVDLLERYVESKGLPFPEDAGFGAGNAAEANPLPNPYTGMTIQELEEYNPSKQQLKDYLDRVLTEWRKEEQRTMEMIDSVTASAALAAELDGVFKDSSRREARKEEEKENARGEEPKSERNDRSKDEIRRLQEELTSAKSKLQKLSKKLKTLVKKLEDGEKLSTQDLAEAVAAISEPTDEPTTENVDQLPVGNQAATPATDPSTADEMIDSMVTMVVLDEKEDVDTGVADRSPQGDELQPSLDDEAYAQSTGSAGSATSAVSAVSRGAASAGSAVSVGSVVEHHAPAVAEAAAPMESRKAYAAGHDLFVGGKQYKDVEDLDEEFRNMKQELARLEDELEHTQFVCKQKIEQHKANFEAEKKTIVLQMQEEQRKVNDLQVELDDIDDTTNLLQRVEDFRNELFQARQRTVDYQKRHIWEIRQKEKERDDALREINMLEIKLRRMRMAQSDQVIQLQGELEKREKQIKHFSKIASSISDMEEQVQRLQADKEALEHVIEERDKDIDKITDELEKSTRQTRAETARAERANDELQQVLDNLRHERDWPVDLPLSKEEIEDMHNELESTKQAVIDAQTSKVQLLVSTATEMERMRTEMKRMMGVFSRRGSLAGSTDILEVEDATIVEKAWTYTLDTIRSMTNTIGSTVTAMTATPAQTSRSRASSRRSRRRHTMSLTMSEYSRSRASSVSQEEEEPPDAYRRMRSHGRGDSARVSQIRASGGRSRAHGRGDSAAHAGMDRQERHDRHDRHERHHSSRLSSSRLSSTRLSRSGRLSRMSGTFSGVSMEEKAPEVARHQSRRSRAGTRTSIHHGPKASSLAVPRSKTRTTSVDLDNSAMMLLQDIAEDSTDDDLTQRINERMKSTVANMQDRRHNRSVGSAANLRKAAASRVDVLGGIEETEHQRNPSSRRSRGTKASRSWRQSNGGFLGREPSIPSGPLEDDPDIGVMMDESSSDQMKQQDSFGEDDDDLGQVWGDSDLLSDDTENMSGQDNLGAFSSFDVGGDGYSLDDL